MGVFGVDKDVIISESKVIVNNTGPTKNVYKPSIKKKKKVVTTNNNNDQKKQDIFVIRRGGWPRR